MVSTLISCYRGTLVGVYKILLTKTFCIIPYNRLPMSLGDKEVSDCFIGESIEGSKFYSCIGSDQKTEKKDIGETPTRIDKLP